MTNNLCLPPEERLRQINPYRWLTSATPNGPGGGTPRPSTSWGEVYSPEGGLVLGSKNDLGRPALVSSAT